MNQSVWSSLLQGKNLLKFCLLFFLTIHFSNASGKNSEPDLKVGERLYYGLIPMGMDAKACASCHTYYTSDTINWNPSVLEMAQVAAEMDLGTFKASLLEPSGDMREKVHVNFQISDEQLVDLHAYLSSLATDGIPPQKMTYNELAIFLLLGLLMALALVDLFFLKKIKYKAIHILIIVLGLSFQFKMLAHEAVGLGRSQGYEPDQPIKFSHQVHAGDNQIDCLYCHSNADEGKSASIPSAGLCMNCHTVVRNGSRSGKFEIQKVVDAYENKKDIEWIRLHNLPDHVYFNHSQHVAVGKLDCTECHGQVNEMHIMKQENDLSMGWCLDCHRTKAVDFENNDYYSIFQQYHKDLQEGVRDSILASDIGATDCMKCHY